MAYDLKTKIAIAVSILTLVLLLLVSWVAHLFFEREFEQMSIRHLSSLTGGIASHVEAEFGRAETILAGLAEEFPAQAYNDQAKVQDYLGTQTAALSIFNNGVLYFAQSGRLLAIHPFQPEVIDVDFSFRPYFRETVRSRQPYISQAFLSRQKSQRPVLMITQPVFDAKGEMRGLLGGSIDLAKNNILADLIQLHANFSIQLLMVDRNGRIILHSDWDKIFMPVSDLLPNTFHADFDQHPHQDFRVTEIGGREMLGVHDHIEWLGWTPLALKPMAEIYQPLYQARIYTAAALLLIALTSIFLVRVLANRLTAPLTTLSRRIGYELAQEDSFRPPTEIEFEELGELAESIQALLVDVRTRRKHLRDQLTFLQNLIDTIPSPIFYKDAEFRYMGCNRAFEEFIGCAREELVGKTTYDIAPAALAAVYHQADASLWEQGGQQVYEAQVRYADASVHDVIFYKTVFHDALGQPSGLLGTFLDITERKQQEIALQASEQRFRLLVENAADSFFLHDDKGRVLDVNRRACEDLGYDRNELLEMRVQDFSVDFDLDRLAEVQKQLEKEQRITLQDRHRRKDGTIFPVEVRVCRAEQQGGVTIALARDISERLESERALRTALREAHAARDQVANILRSAADGIIVTDRRNRVTHINQFAEEILGVKAAEVIDRSFTSLFRDPEIRRQARDFLAIEDVEARQYDFRVVRGGSARPLVAQARTSMLRDQDGQPAGLVTILRDVSRERELDRIKNEFISTAAHEMRTPMSVILGYTDLLQNTELFGEFAAEQQKEFLREIHVKTEALAQLVDDLFDISRIEAGLPVPFDFGPCNLHAIIREVVRYFQQASPEHIFELEFSGRPQIYADANKMVQVLENLISNAVKYSRRGSRVQVAARDVGEGVEIRISDQGIGMDAEQLERVFDKFYRADSSDSAVSGLGLGMSIVKTIIEGHRGTIHLASQPGKGTIVTLDLPHHAGRQTDTWG